MLNGRGRAKQRGGETRDPRILQQEPLGHKAAVAVLVSFVALQGGFGVASGWAGDTGGGARPGLLTFWLDDHDASPDCQPGAIRLGLRRNPNLKEAKAADKADARVLFLTCGKRLVRSADSKPSHPSAGGLEYEIDFRVEAVATIGEHKYLISGRDNSSWRGAGEQLGDALVKTIRAAGTASN